MSKKYLAKILARDLNGLNLISLYCHKSNLKISDIKYLKKNKSDYLFISAPEHKELFIIIKATDLLLCSF